MQAKATIRHFKIDNSFQYFQENVTKRILLFVISKNLKVTAAFPNWQNFENTFNNKKI